MGKTISMKLLFGIYLLLMAGKVFAFSCNVDGGSSIGAGTTSVYVNLDPVIQPGQNLVVDLSQHISCWNDYGGWYDTDHINLVQGSAFAGSLQSYKGSLYWNNVTYPFPLTTNTNVLDIGDKTPMPLPLKLYILPVLGRSEIDMQKSGAQAVTVEDSMSMIHASRGVLKPAGVMLKSECAVVAGIAQAALPQSVVAWEYLVEDYDRIRNDIEAVLPEFADYNQRIRHPGGFHLINAAAERRWRTSSGKANFITSKGLLEDPSSAFNSKLVMATVRSHDQYNTTIYGMDDRYRGVFGQRDVVFMSAKQAKICRVKNGERVNLIALTPDGKRSSRRMDRLKVVIYPMADRSLVTYFPESNHMLTLDNHDPLSGIPGYKSIPVELEPSN